MKKNRYKSITELGNNDYSHVNNPLSYCVNDNNLDSLFLHGGTSDEINHPKSKHCQMFMVDYCSKNWDKFCELASTNQEKHVRDYIGHGNITNIELGLNLGEILVRNTAYRKYLVNPNKYKQTCELFDPNVPTSPLICYTEYCNNDKTSPYCNIINEYSVDPLSIDKDPVMDKILNKPEIAFELLHEIYKYMKKNNTLKHLNGTKLGNFYQNNSFFVKLGGLY